MTEHGISVLVNGCCAGCGCRHDERDVQITDLGGGALRVWCLSCGRYFDTILEGVVADGWLPYVQASA